MELYKHDIQLCCCLFNDPKWFLSDKVGRKQLIILSQFAVSLHTIGYVVSKSYNGIVGTRMLGSIGEGLGGNVMGSVGGPVWQALVTGVTSLETRGSVLGLMGTITGIITTPAPLIEGYLYETMRARRHWVLNVHNLG
jgi:MFS family permease